jgi:hypothetical protein
MNYSLYNGPLPNYRSIRRVPSRSRQILPLRLIRRYRCIVVGTTRDALTVAITDARQKQWIESLERLTGYPIFTVLVDPTRMGLLLTRLERREQQKHDEAIGRPYYLHKLQLHAFLSFILFFQQG